MTVAHQTPLRPWRTVAYAYTPPTSPSRLGSYIPPLKTGPWATNLIMPRQMATLTLPGHRTQSCASDARAKNCGSDALKRSACAMSDRQPRQVQRKLGSADADGNWQTTSLRLQVLLDEGPQQDAQSQGADRGQAALLQLDLRFRPARVRRSKLPVRLLQLAHRAQGGGGWARLPIRQRWRRPCGCSSGALCSQWPPRRGTCSCRTGRPASCRRPTSATCLHARPLRPGPRRTTCASGKQGQDEEGRRAHLPRQQGAPPLHRPCV